MDQLNLWNPQREKLKKEIRFFRDTFVNRIYVVFDDVEKEANSKADEFYEAVMNRPCSEDEVYEASDIAERAMEMGSEYYIDTMLMKYNTLASWISLAYQKWEQQVRKFLYDEVSHCWNIDSKTFCTKGVVDFKSVFKEYGINLEVYNWWHSIEELRLLSNTIKHGDGGAAKNLRKQFMKYFTFENLIAFDRLEAFNTSLQEVTLNIDVNDFIRLCNKLIEFWDELPENMPRVMVHNND